MAVVVTMTRINPRDDAIEVDIKFAIEPGPPYDYARVTVFLENYPRSLADLKTEAIQKAKEFLSHAVSAS